MEYFKNSLKSVLGAPPPGTQMTGAETVISTVNFQFHFHTFNIWYWNLFLNYKIHRFLFKVETLLARVSTSTLLEDRRDACRAIKALSKQYRLEVGAQGMDILRQVLELDRNDSEIIGYLISVALEVS